jgi:preprotein translocase subunit YajC
MKVIGDTDVEVEISSGVNVVIIKSTIAEVERDSSAK